MLSLDCGGCFRSDAILLGLSGGSSGFFLGGYGSGCGEAVLFDLSFCSEAFGFFLGVEGEESVGFSLGLSDDVDRSGSWERSWLMAGSLFHGGGETHSSGFFRVCLGEGCFELLLGLVHGFDGRSFLLAEVADDTGCIGESLAEAIHFRLQRQGIVRARFVNGESLADLGKFVFEGEGALALAFVGVRCVGIQSIDGVAGFFEVGFKCLDALEIAFQAVLSLGELLGDLFVGELGNRFRLERFEVVFEGLFLGFRLAQRVFEFFHPFAGREVVWDGGRLRR